MIGSLNEFARIVSLRGFVNSAPDFFDQPKVVNGASQLMLDVFRRGGQACARRAGRIRSPLNIAVELEMVVEVAEE